ncbi:hypothetical protein DICA2_F17700 [Diutina catenulata]
MLMSILSSLRRWYKHHRHTGRSGHSSAKKRVTTNCDLNVFEKPYKVQVDSDSLDVTLFEYDVDESCEVSREETLNSERPSLLTSKVTSMIAQKGTRVRFGIFKPSPKRFDLPQSILKSTHNPNGPSEWFIINTIEERNRKAEDSSLLESFSTKDSPIRYKTLDPRYSKSSIHC